MTSSRPMCSPTTFWSAHAKRAVCQDESCWTLTGCGKVNSAHCDHSLHPDRRISKGQCTRVGLAVLRHDATMQHQPNMITYCALFCARGRLVCRRGPCSAWRSCGQAVSYLSHRSQCSNQGMRAGYYARSASRHSACGLGMAASEPIR